MSVGRRVPLKGEKPKQFRKTLWRLLAYLKTRRKKLLIVMVAALFSTLFQVISPKLLGDATSSIFASITAGTGLDFVFLEKLLLALGVLYVCSALFSYAQQYLIADVSQRTIAEMRKEVNDKLMRLPVNYFDRHVSGDILSMAVNDIDNINNSLQQALTQMIRSVITVIGIIVMMLVISPLLTLVICMTIPLSLIAVRLIVSFSQKHFISQQKDLGELNGHIEEMYSAHQIVKAFGHEQQAIQTFDQMNDRLYRAGWKAQFISGILMPVMTFISNLGFVFVSIVGGILVIHGSVRIGDVQAFIQYTQQISQPMSQLASVANMIQNALASAERVFKLLDEKEEEQEEPLAVQLENVNGRVHFDHVSFGYEKESPIIRDFTAHVKAGEMVAIVGPTGAGKTTLINLLMRFYDIDQGSISIDNIDLRKFSREQVRNMFAMVLQDTWLFKGTIRDNIGYGSEGSTEESITRAAKAAHADEFIRTLPDGYDTVLRQDASNISQGQRQLLTIARAILANPKILILDEATSNVDTRTEVNIQKAMKSLIANRTSFVIAHRLSTIQDADLILVMDKGNIIEKGTHQQLLGQKGFYAELYGARTGA